MSELPRVRDAFLACLDDVSGDEVNELHRRIGHARSLRELWHLRTTMFGLLARLHSQAEAEQRVAGLNRHFSGHRAPSGLAGLLT